MIQPFMPRCSRRTPAVAALLAGLASLGSGAAQAQSCAAPVEASLGATPVQTTPGVTLNLVGICNVSTTSTDVIHNTSWYRFEAPFAGEFIVSLCGAVNFDSKIAVLTDCSVPASAIACNDDASQCTTIAGQARASRVSFMAAADTAYFIAVGGYSSSVNGSGSMTIESASPPPPPGCETPAQANDGLNAFDTSGSAESLDLTGRCDPGAFGDDVLRRVKWFRWTASSTGPVRISTCGLAAFDTRLAVMAGCAPASVIACNDDGTGCPGFTSELTFDAVAGTEYLVVVGGFDGTSAGPGQFLIDTEAGPPAACGTGEQSCCSASPSGAPFCSDGACCALVCAEDPFCCDASGAWDQECAALARVLCTTCEPAACTLPDAQASEEEPCGGADANGGCNHPEGAVAAITAGGWVAGSFWASGGTRDTDWYEFTVAETTTVTLELRSRGPGQVALVNAACPNSILAISPAALPSCPATVTRCVPAGTYRAVAAPTVFAGIPCGSAGDVNSYRLRLSTESCDASPPANDRCETAQPVPAGGGTFAVDTRLADDSTFALAPECDEGNGTDFVRDVWFRWRPPAGPARVSTCGTADYDTRVAVYTNCGEFSLTVACSDDAEGCVGLTSAAEFVADGTTEYAVRVGGFQGAGRAELRLDRPGVPPCGPDIDGDGQVNGQDLGILLGNWGVNPGSVADLDGDGQVNGQDLGILLGNWGLCPD